MEIGDLLPEVGDLLPEVGDLSPEVGDLSVEIGDLLRDVGDIPVEVSDIPLDVGDIPVEVSDIPLDVGDLLLEIGDLLPEVGDIPLEVGDIPLEAGDLEPGQTSPLGDPGCNLGKAAPSAWGARDPRRGASQPGGPAGPSHAAPGCHAPERFAALRSRTSAATIETMAQEQPKIPLEADIQQGAGIEEEPRTGRIRAGHRPSAHPDDSGAEAESLPGEAFWTRATVEQLAREQGVAVPQPVDDLVGQGTELWENTEDFESFVAGIRERRSSPRNDERMSR